MVRDMAKDGLEPVLGNFGTLSRATQEGTYTTVWLTGRSCAFVWYSLEAGRKLVLRGN